MKIDFDLLDKLEAAGATAKVIIAMLRTQHDVEEAKKVTKRPKDAKRQRERRKATKSDKAVTPSDTERHEATLSDTPRARLFREARPALLTMNIAPSRAGALIVEWLKLTNDDDQLVLATILKAQSMAVVDAPGWILATLRGKTNERAGSIHPNSGPQQSGSTAIIAGVAAATERRARERSAAGQRGQVPRDGDSAEKPDPELFGTR
jgi:hypothetical protein